MTTVHTLRIDGKDVAGNEGQSIMEVAEENGIDIPGLCHLPGIHDRGACRLCVVKIGGSPRPRMPFSLVGIGWEGTGSARRSGGSSAASSASTRVSNAAISSPNVS